MANNTSANPEQPPFPNGRPRQPTVYAAPKNINDDQEIADKTGGTLSVVRPANTISITYQSTFLYGVDAKTAMWPAEQEGVWDPRKKKIVLGKEGQIVQTDPRPVVGPDGKTKYLKGTLKDGTSVWIEMSPALGAPQWGVRGEMEVQAYNRQNKKTVFHFHVLTVWQRWGIAVGKPHEFTENMMTVQPGTYAGYSQIMDAHGKNFPSIWIRWFWNPKTNAWEEGLPRLKGTPEPYNSTQKDGSKKIMKPGPLAKDIFIHPGYSPNFFLGCLSPGSKWKDDTENGTPVNWKPCGHDDRPLDGIVDDKNHQIPANPYHCVWKILHAAGYVPDDQFVMDEKASRTWFLITVSDPDDIFGQAAASMLGLIITVKDQSARPVEGITVSIKPAGGSKTRSLKTNSKGEANFSHILAGSYSVEANFQGDDGSKFQLNQQSKFDASDIYQATKPALADVVVKAEAPDGITRAELIFVRPTYYFAIYYSNLDSDKNRAFERAANFWLRQEQSLHSDQDEDCRFIIRPATNLADFLDAWAAVAKEIRNNNGQVMHGNIFSHASRPGVFESIANEMSPVEPDKLRHGLEFHGASKKDPATLTEPMAGNLEKLLWSADGLLTFHGCNTAVDINRWIVAQKFADTQRVSTVGQMGSAYFSSDEENYVEIGDSDQRIFLWAYQRMRNWVLNSHWVWAGRKIPGKTFSPR